LKIVAAALGDDCRLMYVHSSIGTPSFNVHRFLVPCPIFNNYAGSGLHSRPTPLDAEIECTTAGVYQALLFVLFNQIKYRAAAAIFSTPLQRRSPVDNSVALTPIPSHYSAVIDIYINKGL